MPECIFVKLHALYIHLSYIYVCLALVFFDSFYIWTVFIGNVNGYITIIGEYMLRSFCYCHMLVLGVFLHSPLTWLSKVPSHQLRPILLWSPEDWLHGDLGPDSIYRCHLTSIGNPIVEIRQSQDRLTSTMGFPILVRCHLYFETAPWDELSHQIHTHQEFHLLGSLKWWIPSQINGLVQKHLFQLCLLSSKLWHLINCQILNIRHTLVGNEIVDHSDVVEQRLLLLQLHLHSWLGFNGLNKYKTGR